MIKGQIKKFFSYLASRMFVFFALIALQVWVIVVLLSEVEAYSEWIQLALQIGSIFLVIWIVSKKQNPSYKIAWIILVLALPVFGMTMYFFFSQRKLNPKERRMALGLYEKTHKTLMTDEKTKMTLQSMEPCARGQSNYISKASIYPPYENTSTKYYPMGEDFFEDLLVELKKAEHFIYMEYFIIREGRMWNSILHILEQKAVQGLDVRLMYDDIGCMHTLPAGYKKRMEAKGIKCVVFNPLRPILNSMFNNRDHRKITVIDGCTGFCGGANLSDEYINEKKRFGVWKDASIMLKGEGVWSLLMMFLHLWAFSEREEIDFDSYTPYKQYDRTELSDGLVQPFSDMPLDDICLSEGIIANMISRAQKYLYINTPYLILGNELSMLLENAAMSGVDVRITVPHIPDKKLVFLITKAHYAPLIKAGVKIYEYTPGFIHSKTILCDDTTGMVSTVNLDFRSLYLHFECGVWLHNASCLAHMKQDYLDTVEVSREIGFADTQNVRWYQRFMQAILRIIGPMM
ncbi:cardiolipin synthase [Christensenellaceae bacterium OttesenSCG-928-K19]|nr:cardiolipin synthase [Christensenellaceae bacterium OttesenSCG-928-K19]